jgi:hypothetical protein
MASKTGAIGTCHGDVSFFGHPCEPISVNHMACVMLTSIGKWSARDDRREKGAAPGKEFVKQVEGTEMSVCVMLSASQSNTKTRLLKRLGITWKEIYPDLHTYTSYVWYNFSSLSTFSTYSILSCTTIN